MEDKQGSQDEVEEPEERFLPVPVPPDEHRWWELQLGVRLRDALYTERATGR